LLHKAIAATPEQHTVRGEQRGPDRDTAVRQPGLCLFDCDVHHFCR
jgi:hypothetical protein